MNKSYKQRDEELQFGKRLETDSSFLLPRLLADLPQKSIDICFRLVLHNKETD